MSDCPFCDILAGRLPVSMVAENASVVAFMDIRQAVPGHVLIVPRRHVPNIYELAPDEGDAVMQLALKIARAQRAAFAPEGMNLWQSNGEVAGQEVWHFHLHLGPRKHGDGLLRAYAGEPPAPSPRAYLDKLAAQLRNHLS
jgi:histidine triad (HIT) family protein